MEGEKSIEAKTNQMIVALLENKNKYGMIFSPQSIKLPFGTKVQLRGIDADFVIGDKENKEICKEYFDFSEKQAVKPIIIELLKGVDVSWYEKGNEINYYHEILKNNKEYNLKSGYFILPKGTPLMNKKTFLLLTEEAQAEIDYKSFFDE